jgi:hypothetical protein
MFNKVITRSISTTGVYTVGLAASAIGIYSIHYKTKAIRFSNDYNQMTLWHGFNMTYGEANINEYVHLKNSVQLDKLLGGIKTHQNDRKYVPKFLESYLKPVNYNVRTIIDKTILNGDLKSLKIILKYNNVHCATNKNIINILTKCSMEMLLFIRDHDMKNGLDHDVYFNYYDIIISSLFGSLEKIIKNDVEVYKYLINKDLRFIKLNVIVNYVELFDYVISRGLIQPEYITEDVVSRVIKNKMDDKYFDYLMTFDNIKKNNILYDVVNYFENSDYDEKKMIKILDALSVGITNFSYLYFTFCGRNSIFLLNYFFNKGIELFKDNNMIFCIARSMYAYEHFDRIDVVKHNAENCLNFLKSKGVEFNMKSDYGNDIIFNILENMYACKYFNYNNNTKQRAEYCLDFLKSKGVEIDINMKNNKGITAKTAAHDAWWNSEPYPMGWSY